LSDKANKDEDKRRRKIGKTTGREKCRRKTRR